jgi:hypothetical protein
METRQPRTARLVMVCILVAASARFGAAGDDQKPQRVAPMRKVHEKTDAKSVGLASLAPPYALVLPYPPPNAPPLHPAQRMAAVRERDPHARNRPRPHPAAELPHRVLPVLQRPAQAV